MNNILFRVGIVSCALMPAMASSATERIERYPHYHEGGLLTIPRIDTEEHPAAYQEAVFQLDDQTGHWHLLHVMATDIAQPFFLDGDGITVIVADTYPVQVFLTVKGHLANGCQRLGVIDQRLSENRFDVTIQAVTPILNNGNVVCTQALGPFEKIVPLDVYGLKAGIYEIWVNGKNAGNFELTVDNHLPNAPQ